MPAKSSDLTVTILNLRNQLNQADAQANSQLEEIQRLSALLASTRDALDQDECLIDALSQCVTRVLARNPRFKPLWWDTWKEVHPYPGYCIDKARKERELREHERQIVSPDQRATAAPDPGAGAGNLGAGTK